MVLINLWFRSHEIYIFKGANCVHYVNYSWWFNANTRDIISNTGSYGFLTACVVRAMQIAIASMPLQWSKGSVYLQWHTIGIAVRKHRQHWPGIYLGLWHLFGTRASISGTLASIWDFGCLGLEHQFRTPWHLFWSPSSIWDLNVAFELGHVHIWQPGIYVWLGHLFWACQWHPVCVSTV